MTASDQRPLLEVAAGQPGAGVAPVAVQVALAGPGDGVAQPPVGQGVAPDLPGARAEVGHGDGRHLVVPVLLGDLEAPSQGERRLVGVREPLGGADRVQRPGELLVLAEAFGELDGAPARLDRARDLPGEHPHGGQVGVGGGQRRPRRRRLQHGHRRRGGLERLDAAADAPEVHAAAGQQRPLALAVARSAPALERPLGRLECLGRAVGVRALGGVPLQQLGQPPVLQPAGEAQGRGVVVDRLAVGAEGGGAPGGRGGVLQHGRGHARLLGVVGQPRRLVPGRDHQVGQYLAVQLDASAPATASRSAGSTPSGTTAAASSAPRATGESRPARASTASRTVGGTSPLEAPSTSVTKNGLPPVVWCRRSGSIPWGRARAATASLVSAGSSRRRTQRAVARSPRTLRSGCPGPTSSSR